MGALTRRWVPHDTRDTVVDFIAAWSTKTEVTQDRFIRGLGPASLYRVLSAAGLLDRWNQKPSKKGTGFQAAFRAHEHWHIDVAYINLASTFYYLCTILDGFSRAVVHWDP